MWAEVPEGSCLEAWFDKIDELDADIEWLKVGWYRIWCPKGVEFRTVEISEDLADGCADLETRLRTVNSLKGLI
jgi:hypothetical protein